MSEFNLLYLSVGSGHLLAAQALAQALRREQPGAAVNVFDPLERTFPLFPGLANLGLSWTARFGGRLYAERWRRGDARIIGWAARLPFLLRSLAEGKGAVTAATHVFALRMALARRERAGGGRIYGVVTDFGLHGYWPVQGVDGYFVAHADLALELERRGFAPEKIYASGIPLRLDFEDPGEWVPGRSGGPLRVAVLAGGHNSGAYTGGLRWVEQMLAALPLDPLDVRFTVVAGSRARLLEGLQKLSKTTRFELYPRGLVGDMAGLMRSHDLLLAKPGGLSVAEALACGLPLFCLRAGSGQESANAAFLARYGLWVDASTPELAAQAISRAARDPGWLRELSIKARKLGRPFSAKSAADVLLQGAA